MSRHGWRHQQVGERHDGWILRAMSDAAYDKIKDSYEDMLEQLAEALTNWDEREEAARSAVDKESRPPTIPYKKLMGQIYGWISYPSLDSIRISMISMPSNSSSYPSSYPRQRQWYKTNKKKKTTKKKRTRVSGRFSSLKATTRSCVFRRLR